VPLGCPPGWEGWSDALFAHICASEYGWTLEYIAQVDKPAVLFMRTVAGIHSQASQLSDKLDQDAARTQQVIETVVRNTDDETVSQTIQADGDSGANP
jgi:hypothetical protein